ncbi:MAG: HD domain-containing phosphohydrolase [Gaiellales bacterium]
MLALILAVAAGWAIMSLGSAKSDATQNEKVVREVTADMRGPEVLLVTSSQARLRARGRAALAPNPTAPRHMISYYGEQLARLAGLGVSSGDHHLVVAVSGGIVALATTQDAVYAGGAASLVGARRGPAAAASLKAAFAALDRRLTSRARFTSRLALGGTMVIMLIAALSLIVLLRRFDRMRGRLTDELHEQATHDPLTGLANRRQLSRDLAVAVLSASLERPARLVVFDLDGFKAYNDAFGHHGGDLLLARLARALAAVVAPYGASYRLGGDEFCALFPLGADEHVLRRCVAALRETGDAFTVESSHGSVLLPNDAADPDLAMQLADERMYAEKNSNRASAGQQTRNVALKMLSVQEPDVEHHSAHVAALAEGVGRRLGLTDAERAELVRAAELHDIGKIAIPYAVLHKPTALDDGEWAMMRRHPTIGANILRAAPALGQVAEIVRNSHERFDGKGYPLGLAGTQIPLASRIIFVCDAFDAMVSERVYSSPMSEEGALDQLRKHAGSQFDPDVVSAFCAEHQVQTDATVLHDMLAAPDAS